MLSAKWECEKYNTCTIIDMIEIILLTTIIIGLWKMSSKAIDDYELDKIKIEQYKSLNKDSFYFK